MVPRRKRPAIIDPSSSPSTSLSPSPEAQGPVHSPRHILVDSEDDETLSDLTTSLPSQQRLEAVEVRQGRFTSAKGKGMLVATEFEASTSLESSDDEFNEIPVVANTALSHTERLEPSAVLVLKDDVLNGKEERVSSDATHLTGVKEAGHASPDAPEFKVPEAATRPNSKVQLSKTPQKKRKGISRILEKKGLLSNYTPGLSRRVRIPSLHSNLKPAPPPKAALPKEKERKKKGDSEEYSDEEKPWYETKDYEEWDSDDHDKYAKIVRRRELGLDND